MREVRFGGGAFFGTSRRPNDPYATADEHYGVLRSFTGDPVPVLKDAAIRGAGYVCGANAADDVSPTFVSGGS